MDFFRRYNRIMKITFAVIFVGAVGLFFIQVRTQYLHTLRLMKDQCAETALGLDNTLNSATDHVDAMRRLAERYLSEHPDAPAPGELVGQIRMVPGTNYFALDNVPDPFTTATVANISGFEPLEGRSDTFHRELEMSAALNPIFEIAKMNIRSAAWTYYTSSEEFIAIYPWVPSSEYHFNADTLNQEFYQLGTPARNPGRRRFWTRTYIDQAGQGLMVTCGAPVYEHGKFRGTVALDLTLDFLSRFVKRYPYRNATLFLVDERNQLLAHPWLVKSSDKEVKSIQAAFPPATQVQIDKLFQVEPLTTVHLGDTLFFYLPLKTAPWRLVCLAPRKPIIMSLISESILILIILLGGMTVMLVIANSTTRNEFIRPAEQLVGHIARACQEPDAPAPKVPEPWRPWVVAISRIFKENARLLGELRKQNEQLDGLVEERTQELRVRNSQLEQALSRLKDMQNQIVMQEKMASLGGLTAGIAHEIKNPLNFVNNFAELSADLCAEMREIVEKLRAAGAADANTLADIEDVVASLEQNVRKIQEHGKRADSIVRGMLLHSRGKAGERRPTDINALVTEYVNLAYHGLRAQDTTFNVKIEMDMDPEVGTVDVVPQDMSRAILNVVNNGCYAANEKKRETKDSDFMPTIRVSTKSLNGSYEIRMRDNGMGIPPELREKIFTPFFTTKPTGKGTGLGLSITYDIIVREHGGDIRIESEPGQYTEFIFRIPKSTPGGE